MTRRVPIRATPVAVLLVTLAFLLAVLIFVPRVARSSAVQRPPRPTVVAAIRTTMPSTINGRISSMSDEGFTVRLLLGTMTVVELRRTRFLGAGGESLPEAQVRKGDRVIVVGYKSGHELLAVSIRDTSRR